jgi:PAS domain S-box-containing protein
VQIVAKEPLKLENNGMEVEREQGLTMTRILLADEHQIMRQGLRALFEREPDLEVVGEADNGPTLVRLVRDLVPDLVLLDLGLPDLQGVEAVRQILAAAPRVKILVLSILSDRRFVVNALKAGASGYLMKDCAFEELTKAIRAVLEDKTFISAGLSDIVVQDYFEGWRASEARFQTIFEAAPWGIALVDRDGRIVDSNPSLQRLLGYQPEELLNQGFAEFIRSEDARRCHTLFRELVEEGSPSLQMEVPYIHKDGQVVWSRLTVSPVRGPKVEDQFAICMIEDISNQKQADRDIRTYQEQLRSVASELSLTEERERRRLATDLHDHVGQILALAQIKLGAIRESASSTQLAEPMDDIRRLIEQTIQYTRSLTFELSPPILYDLGFEAAVEWLAELMHEQHGITIKVQADRASKPLSDEFRVLLFQTMRELLGNVVKHTNAKHIRVFIGREHDTLQVKVEDDGLGLGASPEIPLDGPYAFGFFSIRERLKYLGGSLNVETEPGWGTRVTLGVPLKY